jgi:hypothetical protein
MQDGAAHTQRMAFRKLGLEGNAAIHESNAAEGQAGRLLPPDAKSTQCRQAVGHQPFAAYFVDGRARTIGKRDRKPFTARGDSGRQPGGAASNDK